MADEQPKKPHRKGRESIYTKWVGGTVELPPHKTPAAPTKYDPRFCELLIAHMSEGKSFNSFPAQIGVSASALYDWVEKHPEFKEAKAKGHAAALLFFEDTGIDALHAGKQFNQNMWMFLMKTRFRNDGYREKYAEDDAGVNITNNSLQLTPGALADLIRVARGEVQEPKALPPGEARPDNQSEAQGPSLGTDTLASEKPEPTDR